VSECGRTLPDADARQNSQTAHRAEDRSRRSANVAKGRVLPYIFPSRRLHSIIAARQETSNMTPEQRFHSYVTAGTVLVMFYFIQRVVPMLTFPPRFEQIFHPALTLLLSAAIYQFLASALIKITRK
jgi:hypothetical protein